MFLIADCGATKCDWAVSDGDNANFFSGNGFNPVHTGVEAMEKTVSQAVAGNVDPGTIDEIHSATKTFFLIGAGVISSPSISRPIIGFTVQRLVDVAARSAIQ
ncbi:MAG: hypothetical protein IIT32_02660, partial [Bacteroidales bacterium]|nr:hypothetical protein [Bacteroidales bacterium]